MRLDPNDAKLYVYAISVSGGKVKRIRNKPLVNLAPCDMRDGWQGEWVPSARRPGVQAQHREVVEQKYAPWKQLLDFAVMFRKRERTVFVIRAN